MIGPPTRVCTCTRTCVYLRAVYPHGEEEADDDEDADRLGLTLALSVRTGGIITLTDTLNP